MTAERVFSVLVVDDNEDDLELLKRALQQVESPLIEVFTARDGIDAIQQLATLSANGKRPELAIVDLKMPRLDGRAFLRGVRAEPAIALLPVLVLSTSRANEDVDGCYRDGCNAYFHKPLEFTELVSLAAEIVGHWLGRVQRPLA